MNVLRLLCFEPETSLYFNIMFPLAALKERDQLENSGKNHDNVLGDENRGACGVFQMNSQAKPEEQGVDASLGENL